MMLCTESFTLGLPLRMLSVRRTGRRQQSAIRLVSHVAALL
jgi:hypothetical protein